MLLTAKELIHIFISSFQTLASPSGLRNPYYILTQYWSSITSLPRPGNHLSQASVIHPHFSPIHDENMKTSTLQYIENAQHMDKAKSGLYSQ